jgi:hypothetical protein
VSGATSVKRYSSLRVVGMRSVPSAAVQLPRSVASLWRSGGKGVHVGGALVAVPLWCNCSCRVCVGGHPMRGWSHMKACWLGASTQRKPDWRESPPPACSSWSSMLTLWIHPLQRRGLRCAQATCPRARQPLRRPEHALVCMQQGARALLRSVERGTTGRAGAARLHASGYRATMRAACPVRAEPAGPDSTHHPAHRSVPSCSCRAAACNVIA